MMYDAVEVIDVTGGIWVLNNDTTDVFVTEVCLVPVDNYGLDP